MNVESLKLMMPLEDICELRSEAKYLITLKRRATLDEIVSIGRLLQAAEIRAVIVDYDMRFSGVQSGNLEVGHTVDRDVVINHTDLLPDKDGVGHIVFSPKQALDLAELLVKHAKYCAS